MYSSFSKNPKFVVKPRIRWVVPFLQFQSPKKISLALRPKRPHRWSSRGLQSRKMMRSHRVQVELVQGESFKAQFALWRTHKTCLRSVSWQQQVRFSFFSWSAQICLRHLQSFKNYEKNVQKEENVYKKLRNYEEHKYKCSNGAKSWESLCGGLKIVFLPFQISAATALIDQCLSSCNENRYCPWKSGLDGNTDSVGNAELGNMLKFQCCESRLISILIRLVNVIRGAAKYAFTVTLSWLGDWLLVMLWGFT